MDLSFARDPGCSSSLCYRTVSTNNGVCESSGRLGRVIGLYNPNSLPVNVTHPSGAVLYYAAYGSERISVDASRTVSLDGTWGIYPAGACSLSGDPSLPRCPDALNLRISYWCMKR
jgi:hypothetical protein